MKIAVLGDIHGNYRALQAVADHVDRWEPDLVFVLGDTINRGPRSRECLAFILQQRNQAGWHVIRGNHEEYVLNFEQPDQPTSGSEYEYLRFVHWTYQQTPPEQVREIHALPYQIDQTLVNRQEIRGVHASMRGLRSGIYPSTEQSALQNMISPAPHLLMVGHTHYPLTRQLENTLVVNAGSVGFPFDGDTRPCYAQLFWEGETWQVDFIRVPYDHQAALEDFTRTAFREQGGPMVDVILTEIKLARPQLSHWNHRYLQPVLEGKIPLGEAVEAYLETPNRRELK
jgi:putative phosphoesterase